LNQLIQTRKDIGGQICFGKKELEKTFTVFIKAKEDLSLKSLSLCQSSGLISNQQLIMTDEQLELRSASQIKGKIIMSKDYYVQVANFILSSIVLRMDEEISLSELLDEAQDFFSTTLGYRTSWYILQVKHDLEIRGLIKKQIGSERIQLIKVNKRKLKERWPHTDARHLTL
jgi:hypothetical protein